MQRSESAGPTAPVRNYDVFLNHRGLDTKKSFVDHLSASFATAGVHSFVDHKKLKVGEDSWDAIESAIRHSKVHIAIFSPGYADSSWCLRELHEMLECRANGSSDLLLPVFYKVTPHDLRHSSSRDSCYSSVFAKLRREKNPEVQNWESALNQASMVNGWTLDDAAKGFEARLVKLIVSEVLNVLNRTLLHIAKHPVGVKEKLQEALDLMEIDKVQKGVHILGIFGMGGVGKTTLAKSIYNGIYRDFECWSLMESVRSEAKTLNGLRGVQERMLRALLKTETISVTSTSHGKQIMKERFSGLKILIILDDVDDREQLEELLPPIESCLLMDGSQIVITTRDEQIVTWAKARQRLHMQGLSEPHAHLLFNWHAFLRREEPSEDFKMLAKKVVKACKGLPLALETLGSHLYNKDVAFWEETVKVLEGNGRSLSPAQRKVTSILRISFDGLGSEEERSMFLDIACFLLGEQKARARRIWRESDAAELCLETLRLKSLVKVDQDGRLTMHDLLRDMGREIVGEKAYNNIWKRSHLWNKDDVRVVLRNQKGTSEVRGVCLAMEFEEEWDTKSFAGMDVLQLLVLSDGNITGDFSFFSKELRWFQWRYSPLESLPSELALNNVAVLDLMGSKISSLSPSHKFENLRELSLRECSNLKELPELGGCYNLEMLDLGWCVNLESLPESIGCLSSSLTHLNLSWCSKLTTLPDGIVHLHFLKTLLLNKCSALIRLPDAIGQLTALEEIGLEDLESITLVPQSFGNLTNLSSLNLDFWDSLKELPSTIGNLRKLTSLTISSCSLIWEISQGASSLTNLVNLEVGFCDSMSRLPENIGNLHKLVTLNLRNNQNLSYVPSSIGKLKELVTLDLGNCKIGDGGLPKEYATLSSLQELLLPTNSFSRLPKDFHLLSKLQTLDLHYCWNLREISHLPPSLTVLDISDCWKLREISHLPPSLTDLNAGECVALTRLSSLSSLKKLRKLVLRNCQGLEKLMGLDCLSHLEELNISGCKGLINLPQFSASDLPSLRLLYLAGSGVSLLQDRAPWIQNLVSLELVTLYGKLPECFSSCKREVIRKENAKHCCMEVRVPEGDMACKGVVCCISSHDQGVSPWREQGHLHVQAKVLEAEGDSPKFSQSLFDTTHGNSRNHLHISIFRATHPFVATLKGGDTIRVVAFYDFTWDKITTVTEGAVKLIYDENEMEEILQELSMQTINNQTISNEEAQLERIFEEMEPSDEMEDQSSEMMDIMIRGESEAVEENEMEESNEMEGSDEMEDPIRLELTIWSVDGGLPDVYSTLSSLQKMNLQFMPIAQLPSDFHLLTNLRSLALRHCDNLNEIPCLPPALVELDLGDSPSLRSILCLSSLKELRDLVLCNCSGLVELVGLDCLAHLSQLNITGCGSLMSLPSGLEHLTSLKFLYMAGSGVSLLQDNEPWIQKLASLELISVYADEVPDCLPKVKLVGGVIGKQHANECGMERVVPEVDAAYRAALFFIVSHDQGWSGLMNSRNQGRYRHSPTSMHIEIIEREADSPKFSQVLFVNRYADDRNQLHISIFRTSHPFIASLKGGDTIRVLAKSSHQWSAITVRDGAGELMSGENEVDETLRTLSKQLKLKCQEDKFGDMVYHFSRA